ncbi:hypothetical protein [Nocardia testacea]|uniref:hypothetical protein n=1 Tax=Nocardia testacea TaxID=248551 RepID=UPI0033E8F7CB
MSGTNVEPVIAQMLRRISVAVDDVTGVVVRDTESIARGVNHGQAHLRISSEAAAVLTKMDKLDKRSTAIRRAGVKAGEPAVWVTKFPGKWTQPPVRRVENGPALIADELERIYLAGDKARWANYDPGLLRTGHRGFENWLKTEGPLAPLSEHYGLNCWEMIGYAAVRSGVLDKHQLRELMEVPRRPLTKGAKYDYYLDAWLPRMGEWLIPEGRQTYTGKPGGPQPRRGDIVMWNNDAEHVTMATGRIGHDGSPEVYSFWYAPKDPLVWDPSTQSYSAVTDAVQKTTVKELTEAMYNLRDKDGNPAYTRNQNFEVMFGRGPW